MFKFFKSDKDQQIAELQNQVDALKQLFYAALEESKKKDKELETSRLSERQKDEQIEALETDLSELRYGNDELNRQVDSFRQELEATVERNRNQAQALHIAHDRISDIENSETLSELLKHSKKDVSDFCNTVDELKNLASLMNLDYEQDLLSEMPIETIWDHLNESQFVQFLKDTDRLDSFLEFFDKEDLMEYLGLWEVGDAGSVKIFYQRD